MAKRKKPKKRKKKAKPAASKKKAVPAGKHRVSFVAKDKKRCKK